MLTITIVVKENPDGSNDALIVSCNEGQKPELTVLRDLTDIPEEVRRLLAYNMWIEGNVH